MKPTLYLCIKNPLSERDMERMGIEALATKFNLLILDTTAWLMPAAFRTRGTVRLDRADVRCIHSLSEFRNALGTGGYAVDYVGPFSPSATLMFEALRSRGIKLIVVDSGPYPSPESVLGPRSVGQKLVDALRHGGIRQHFNSRINRLLLKLLPDQRPDCALVSGSWWKSDPRFSDARRQIPAHTFDYEKYRQLRDTPLPRDFSIQIPYAVYLDEDLAGHEDNEEMGLETPATAASFYPKLSGLFDTYETALGLRVLIAGYPSNRPGCGGRFFKRSVFVGRTADLVRGAKFVFAHASTAISFAVLWKKPIIFLTSDELKRSWYQSWIEAPRNLLNAQLISIDDESSWDCSRWGAIDESAYLDYRRAFIKSDDSPDIPLWDIFLKIQNHEALS